MPDDSFNPRVAFLYSEDAYSESVVRGRGGPVGLMGRQVAGKSFLDAYLRHGRSSSLAALVPDRAGEASLARTWRDMPASLTRGRAPEVFRLDRFHETFFPDSPIGLLHVPCPPQPRFAWARQQGQPSAFALSGVTHTLCSEEAVDLLRDLVTAPFEAFDSLVCTSRAVEAMVLAVTGSYSDYLRDRFGGRPGLRVILETIPLGVDTDRFRPATPEERSARREEYGIAGDAVVVLFVGRLSHHAKAHPFPMFRGLAEAAAATGRPVHLLLAGWAAHPVVREAFAGGAEAFGPGVRTSILDGVDPSIREGAWHAADVFVSLSDSIQETFGLVVIEAMASGLPVVATDWDGYRDLVVDGETGYLVPTAMVAGATGDATARLVLGEVNYDHFLAECSQATVVDVASTASALARLIADEPRRRRMGEAGRKRALERFAWPVVIRSYEDLWDRQERERRSRASDLSRRWTGPAGPAAYPSPERTFAGYPTRQLGEADRVLAVPGSDGSLGRLLATPLTNHSGSRRAGDVAAYRSVLAACPCPIGELDRLLTGTGLTPGEARATITWMLKYDLLRPEP